MSNEEITSTDREYHNTIEIRTYEQTSTNIHRLTNELPEDVVMSLAREVISRVGSRENKLLRTPAVPSNLEIIALCDALLSKDEAAAAQFIMHLRHDGTKTEDIHLIYMARAARMLGDMWDDNKIDFVTVTLGTGRLLAIMRGMRPLFETPLPVLGKTAIFASVPGENHTIGVRMATDIFRKDGWEIDLKVGLDHNSLVDQIERQPSGIIGLSIGGKHSMEPLSKLVVALNICCPHSLILVCGQDVEHSKPVLQLMGLDAIAETFHEAKQKMAELWDRKTEQSPTLRSY